MTLPLRRLQRRRRARLRRRHVAVGALLGGLLLIATAVAAVALALQSPQAIVGCHIAHRRPQHTGGDTLLTAADGSPLGYVPTRENREPVPLAGMSPWLPKATVAIEDRRFWQHGALDPLAIGRSALADLVHGRVLQGGSTLTQQLVRNRYLSDRRMTFPRKLTEACLASELFQRWTRRQILESYLDTVYYGQRARGVQAAAWTYYSRPARRLSLVQAAMIAGLPQAPTAYDPLRHPIRALRRRNAVLLAMQQAGDISGARRRSAQAKPLHLRPSRRYARVHDRTFFGAALTAVQARLGAHRAATAGLRIRTTLDPHLQALAQRAIDHWIATPGGPASALVAIDPRTGDVRAMATRAPGAPHLRFNLATQSRRQAGSAFKVFTLATALEQGIPLSSVWHGPPSLTIPDPRCDTGAGHWQVHNFADEKAGTMTLADAIARSVNTIFAQVAVRVGPPAIVRTAHRMGVTSPLIPVCSITLGPEGVSPLEMADAFATLATGGIHHPPRLLEQAGPPRGDRALPAGIAAQVTSALTGVIRFGTGTAADPGRPAAGKTGTAENESDAWFCGYVPQLAACVWVGHPEGEVPMPSFDGFAPVVGGSVPARIWHDFMVPALAGRPVLPLAGLKATPTPAPFPTVGPT